MNKKTKILLKMAYIIILSLMATVSIFYFKDILKALFELSFIMCVITFIYHVYNVRITKDKITKTVTFIITLTCICLLLYKRIDIIYIVMFSHYLYVMLYIIFKPIVQFFLWVKRLTIDNIIDIFLTISIKFPLYLSGGIIFIYITSLGKLPISGKMIGFAIAIFIITSWLFLSFLKPRLKNRYPKL